MKIEGLLLDVEGVLVTDKRYQPVEGAVDFVRRVRKQGLGLRLISNNTTDTVATLAGKLNRVGFDFGIEEIRTCTTTAVTRLRVLNVERCLVLGTPALQGIFADEGFVVANDSKVDAVVVGLDTDWHFERLRLACEAVMRFGARLIALHRNRVFTDSRGRIAPSVGPVVEAIQYATQAPAEVMGKPNEEIYRQALREIDVPPPAALMVSDDPFSDLVGAKRLGIPTAFVLSGKYAARTVLDQLPATERPDVTVNRIGDLSGTAWLPV